MKRRNFLKQTGYIAAVAVYPSVLMAGTAVVSGPVLDLAEACRFLERYPPESNFLIFLTEYKSITPEALELFSSKYNSEEHSISLALTEMDRNTAQILANWNPGFLEFTELRSLDSDIAAILSDTKSLIDFRKLYGINPPVARELARVKGTLSLNVESISLSVATELIHQESELFLNSLRPPSKQVLNLLSEHQGYYLSLGGWDTKPDYDLHRYASPNGDKKILLREAYGRDDITYLRIMDADLL